FREFGIEPIVLTVDPEFATFPNYDYSLLKEIPEGIEIHTSQASSPFELYKKVRKKDAPQAGFSGEKKVGLTDKLMRFVRGNFFIPDARIGWNKFALEKARTIIRENNIDSIVTTSPPHSTQLIGLQLKQEFNLHWLADLRDPWTEIYYNQELFRTPFAKRKDYKFEQTCLKNADKIVVVSEDIKRHFGAKRKEILDKIHVIPNGFDEADFNIIPTLNNVTPNCNSGSNSQKISENNSKPKIISYVGNLGEQYPVEGFLDAFAEIVKTDSNWKLQFVGNCHGGVKQMVESLKISVNVEFIPYVNHSEAIDYMLKASILLLIIPEIENNKGILTGKLFEYLATGNPILNIGPKDGDAAVILRENAVSVTLNPNEKQAIIDFILNSTTNQTEVNTVSKNKFSRRNLTGDMAKLILE
ncbi:MAG: glycosyltransferase, partial [Crocinitomicaceae bacterium]|nr:glycosyltransferase [Crocinitomicaceae bacterium]